MANEDKPAWPPPHKPDPESWERVTEGQNAILGTGGPAPERKDVPSAPTEDS